MIVATYNIQNKKGQNEEEKAKLLLEWFEKENIDVVGLQEVSPNVRECLKKQKQYFIVGDHRLNHHFLLKRIPLFSLYNEAVPLLSKSSFEKEKTILLPWIPNIKDWYGALFVSKSLTPRVLTMAQRKEKDKIITILNTHLEKRYVTLQKRQLKKILTILKRVDTPFLLFGDFNLRKSDPLFSWFYGKIQEFGGSWVEIKEATLKSKKKKEAIDHIFYRGFQVKEVILQDPKISDHFFLKVVLEDR